ncbi:B12-binding domain-containing radical SAM protein [Mediterraneibacter glycyrrhizinilyticus]|uniref:B12-binding domain-containing radical SAM protein n=1 Tax=Mediterraneibacter glycyrrhizinilyticus TaxID=342942 RepID=UPI0025A4CB3F|nr:B12-binding domain-containing radical SAM protein [Mediterraneibacter glycyrrhizinilyticus]MDM8210815.1 B12-binding domain-containing radical SAM protein [Mediterraneibacter glycyrrhizinilyticus]
MNIFLAAINAKYIHSNLAVYSLRAYARKYTEETEIAEYTINQPIDEILMDIYTHRPDILCFSCYLWNISYVEQLIREIPKVLPDTKIWLGGPEVSYNAREMLDEYPGLTGIICGEGEETFLELMDYYHSGIETETEEKNKSRCIRSTDTGLSGIRGIVYRTGDGNITETPSRPVLDLSTVPFVYGHIEDFRNRIIYYESSRGCPFSCSYCLSSIDKCLRFRDPELVKKELQFFIDHEVPQVKFVDRTFNCRHDHAMTVWRYIKEHDRGITNFHFEIAADLLNEEQLSLIRSMRPGLIQLEIGIQSANEETIREIRRKMDLDMVEHTVDKVRENRNVHQHLDLIAGLPYEDYDSFAKSFDRVYAMRPDQLQLGFLKVLKGSLMHEKTQEYGLVYQDRPPYEVLSTKWLPYADVIRLKKIEEMVEVYYNSGQFRNTMEHIEKEFPGAFAMFGALADYYEENGLFGLSHSRIARYEILFCFLEKRTEKHKEKLDEYAQWLTLDLYLRDNVRNRPQFLPDNKVSSDEAAAFYKAEEEEHRYLSSYTGYDRRQMRKMTHLERLFGRLILFDYRERNPLSGDAKTYKIKDQERKIENEFS